MSDLHQCDSCGMTINDGTYCAYCVGKNGELQTFEERFERMVQWAQKEGDGLSREKAEDKTKAYMRTMPAWKNHLSLREKGAE